MRNYKTQLRTDTGPKTIQQWAYESSLRELGIPGLVS
jgi:hypothetical protein